MKAGCTLKEVVRDAMKFEGRVQWVKEDEIGGVWVARIGHAGIEWNVTE